MTRPVGPREDRLQELQRQRQSLPPDSDAAWQICLEIECLQETAKTLEKIADIERLYEQASYEEAYREFHALCSAFPKFRDQASSILSRFNHLNNAIIHRTITNGEQNVTVQQIGHAFKSCLRQFKHSLMEK